MKKTYLIFLFLLYNFCYSQTLIDTSKVSFVQYEWKINIPKKDSILDKITTKYKSGIYKEELIDLRKEEKEYPLISIFESKTNYFNNDLKSNFKLHYFSGSFGKHINFYDNFGILDSIYISFEKDSLREWKYKIEKKIRKNGKLNWLVNYEGEKEVYFYNIIGKLKKVEIYKDTLLYEIQNYKNGILVSRTFPTREKYRKKFIYEYDKHGRILKRDESDYEYFKYEYNQFGLIKIERFYKKQNKLMGFTIFSYDKNGLLKSKKEYFRIKLQNEFSYSYK
ncbi:hypothetical protein M9Q43_13925 [Flavobacterium sp. HXWNR29]|uniref:hypothetical protein n=1 Tax=Flavobacterium odoriferum TaxID=2946604 RepID=UPI0021CB7C4F|nr:hypothetical protein [Flavobacterium sp. HXWNR29]MCU4190258.1 hypothetical protein [Flavobacterium sp. HXWNR29]